MHNAFLKYALQDQKAVSRVQVEQVWSSGVKLGQMGSSRVMCDQEGPKAVKRGLVG